MNEALRYVAPTVRVSQHCGELVLFNVGTGLIFRSDRTGVHIWSRLSAGLAEEEIAHEISAGLSVSRERTLKDVGAFVQELERRKFLCRRRSWSQFRLTAWAWVALVLHDLRIALGRFGMVDRSLQKLNVSDVHGARTLESVCGAVALAACLYWKPVRCLQRATVTVRMLRRCGIAATLVIAYRPAPFLAHAYAEVDQRIVNDSQAYPQQMKTLYRQEPAERETR
jgi:hypothetical protein